MVTLHQAECPWVGTSRRGRRVATRPPVVGEGTAPSAGGRGRAAPQGAFPRVCRAPARGSRAPGDAPSASSAALRLCEGARGARPCVTRASPFDFSTKTFSIRNYFVRVRAHRAAGRQRCGQAAGRPPPRGRASPFSRVSSTSCFADALFTCLFPSPLLKAAGRSAANSGRSCWIPRSGCPPPGSLGTPAQ